MIGRSLSQFTITAKLGEGGMGEVYRATDTRLGRDVAIKILPGEFTQDPARLARFEREAKLLAALNHQNIAAIHQVEQVEGIHFLVMELVEGETLSERLGRGAMPVEEALRAAVQVTEALEAAHEKGIVHRDLKPANIKITPEGRIKVLDFGLAKAWDAESDAPDHSRSPTMTAQMTRAGMILGTAAYMSPEQAKGQAADRRSDIWAFGVVLWEMLKGSQLFAGDSVAEILASVLKTEVDLDPLPPRTPARIRRLLEGCLRRDPRSRLRDIGDARIEIEQAIAGREWEIAASVPAVASKSFPATTAALLLALGIVAGGVATYFLSSRDTADAAVTSVAIPLKSTFRIVGAPLLTPDGRTAVFLAIDADPGAADHRPRIYSRRLDENQVSRLEGSEGARVLALSPDGRWIAYVAPISRGSARYQLTKVPIDRSAPPSRVADWPDLLRPSLVWPAQDRILGFRGLDGAIVAFSPDGGPPAEPRMLDGDLDQRWIEAHMALPGSRNLLVFYASFKSGAYRQDAGLLDYETGELRHLVDDASHPWYAPTGHIVFSRRGDLLAAPFDLTSRQVTGGAQAVLDGVWSEGLYTGGDFSLSARGDLLYGAGEVQGLSRSIGILGRDGTLEDWSDDRFYFENIWVSPDGSRLAVEVDNVSQGDALLQVRVSGFDRPRLVTVGSQPGKDCGRAAWSTDSRHLAYICWDNQTVSLHTAGDGGASGSRLLLEEPVPGNLGFGGFTAGDSSILLRRLDASGSIRLISVPFDPDGSEPRPVSMEEKNWWVLDVSPDGRWLSYIADESGRRQLFVREILDEASVGPRIPATSESIEGAFWSNAMRNGRYEILFHEENRNFSIEMTTGPPVSFSDPRVLDHDPFALGMQGLSTLPDGRFVISRAPDTELGAPELRLILNWTRRLAEQVPAP